MAVDLAYWLFAASCALLLWQGFRERDGMLQFPFLAGAVFSFYLFSQASGLYFSHASLPAGAFAGTLFMFSLCAVCCWLGWRAGGRITWRRTAMYDSGRVFLCGVVLILVSWAATYKLAELSGGLRAHFSTEGGYSYQWSGLPVRYAFFAQFGGPALVLFLMAYFARPSGLRAAFCAMTCILPLVNIVVLGRRSMGITLGLQLLLAYYFYRRKLPRRFFLPLLAPVALVILYVVPSYRVHSQLGADHSKIMEIDVGGTIRRKLAPSEVDAVANATYAVGAVTELGRYGLGTGFWDGLVGYWVPRQIVGEEFKASLQIRRTNPDAARLLVYGHARPPHEFYTGPAAMYCELWYFGAAFYVLLGLMFRVLWDSATRGANPPAQALYMILIGPAVISVAFSPFMFVSEGVRHVLTLMPVFWWAAQRAEAAQPLSGGGGRETGRPGQLREVAMGGRR
jgi:hypothetical protein